MKIPMNKKSHALALLLLFTIIFTSLGVEVYAKSEKEGRHDEKHRGHGHIKAEVNIDKKNTDTDEHEEVVKEKREEERHEHERVKNATRIDAHVFQTQSKINIRENFSTAAATSTPAIAELIADKMKLTKDDIARLLMVKHKEGEPKEAKEKLRVRAEVRNGIMRVKSEFRFGLASTTRESIIDGIFSKLSALTANDILAHLTLRIKHHHGQSH